MQVAGLGMTGCPRPRTGPFGQHLHRLRGCFGNLQLRRKPAAPAAGTLYSGGGGDGGGGGGNRAASLWVTV